MSAGSARFETTRGIRHHTSEECDGLPCPFHGPSLHPMIEEPMHLRETGLIERTCRHGVGHPDPDSAAFFDRHYGHKPGTWSVHGCDGCCRLPEHDDTDERAPAGCGACDSWMCAGNKTWPCVLLRAAGEPGPGEQSDEGQAP